MDNNSGSGGLGIFSVLTIIFIVLKLCNVITWSWWLVFSPFFIEFGLFLLVIIVTFMFIKK